LSFGIGSKRFLSAADVQAILAQICCNLNQIIRRKALESVRLELRNFLRQNVIEIA
jgi:hypothetical protein